MPLPDVREDGKQRIKCCACHATLGYGTPRPVRAGGEIEIKCWKCNAMNYLLGREAA